MTTGHNSTLGADDRFKLFVHHFKSDLADELALRAIKARKSANRKIAKGHDATFTAQKFDHYMKIHLGEDDQKPVDRLKSDRENLEWAGIIPPTTGGDLLAQADRVDREQMIRAKGFEAGMLGRDRVSGYDGGSADDRLWLDSFDEGDKEFKADIPDILARVEAARTNEEPAPTTDNPFGETPAEAAE
jgi:hypothetical protein